MEDPDRRERDPVDEEIVREETAKAAEEAARIGGAGTPGDLDEAERPLVEAGEGPQEGFDEAERDLIEHASHGDDAPSPEALAGEPEPDLADVEYGEADRVESSERSEEGQEGRDLPDEPPLREG